MKRLTKVPVRWKIRVIFIVFALTFAMTERQIERMGDHYQVALPILGLACSLTNGQAVGYVVRYALQQSVVTSSKAILGEAEINHRPRGGYQGMPSGHTAASFFGASYLARDCVGGNIWMQAGVFLTAGYVGYSRVQPGAHTILQVLLGALVGLLGDRALSRLWASGRIQRLFRRKGK